MTLALKKKKKKVFADLVPAVSIFDFTTAVKVTAVDYVEATVLVVRDPQGVTEMLSS